MKHTWFAAIAGVMAGFMLSVSMGTHPLASRFSPGAWAACGDGIDDSEDCDDGNTANGDGCSDACAVESGWTCDASFPSTCTETCGDSVMVGDEECDDGDTDNGDGCSSTCQEEAGWTCDNDPLPSTCTEDPFCGDTSCAAASTTYDSHTYYRFSFDGTWSAAEANCEAIDGYLATITSEEEQTELTTLMGANRSHWIGLTDTAAEGTFAWQTEESDAYTNWETGQPDDGASDEDCAELNSVDLAANGKWNDYDCDDSTEKNDGFLCEVGACGDGRFDLGEACDDDNTDAGDGCSATCTLETGFTCSGEPSVCETQCGDSVVAGDEECDDGGTDGGDGCSELCAEESGYACTGEPSVCATVCGDGIMAGAEQCDDGDATGGDGCSSSCRLEPGFSCANTPSLCAVSTGGNSGKFREETASYERKELRTSPKPVSEADAFKQYRELFSTSLSSTVIELILSRIDWPECGGRSRRAPVFSEPPLQSADRAAALARIASKLCLSPSKTPLPYIDFDPRAPYAQPIRALWNTGVALGSFDENGLIGTRLEPRKPITFLELVSIITQLRKRGYIDWQGDL